MENYVVSRELAEKLKAAGYPQTETGQFYWYREPENEQPTVYSQNEAPFYGEDEWCAAPLSDELLEQLPPYTELLTGQNSYIARYSAKGHNETADKPADALAELYLWCKEHNYV